MSKRNGKHYKTYSDRSMISKPFVERMAIPALRKMRSNDSDGRKKSYSDYIN
jgi:hypothetical protein